MPEIRERYAGMRGITQGDSTEINPEAKAIGIWGRKSDMGWAEGDVSDRRTPAGGGAHEPVGGAS